MTLAELKTVLEGVFPGKVVYHAWPENTAPALPWVCIFETGAANESADNIVFFSAHQVNVELYTEKKDTAKETSIEAALTAAEIYYEKDCEYLSDEKMHMTTYTVEV